MFLTLFLYEGNFIGFDGVLTCTISMMGSFGPVVALSSLSNNLNQTLASGERVLSILEEKPQVEEVPEAEPDFCGEMLVMEGAEKKAPEMEMPEKNASGTKGETAAFNGKIPTASAKAEVSHVDFSYKEEQILKNVSLTAEPGQIVGIHGASGSGKSTMNAADVIFEMDAGRVS